MSHNQRTDDQRAISSRNDSSAPTRDPSKQKTEEWADVQDPEARRKIQNKLAQRRFRDRAREQKEEAEREIDNQQRAGSSYAPLEPSSFEQGRELSGLPWGGISMKHIVETGKTKEQNSQRSSRESSVYAATSRTGGSSR